MKKATIALVTCLLIALPALGIPARQDSSLLERLQRYLSYDTQSFASKTHPSTPKQLELANLLKSELRGLGVEAKVDAAGNVVAILKGNADAPTIAFISHLDTLYKAGKPKVIRNYSGEDIKLGQGVLRTREHPDLKDFVGADLVVSDGKNPAGLDNKAGLAICMTALETLKKDPKIKHGDLKFVFISDATQGLYRLEAKAWDADAAYLIDGGAVGEITTETFCASTVVVTVFGRDCAPGYAKGRMINALPIAAKFLERLSPEFLPERSENRQGFIFPYDLRGGASKATVTLLVRAFERTELTDKEDRLRAIAAELQAKYPQAKVTLEVKPSSRNLKEFLDREPRILDNLLAACKKLDIKTVNRAVRGTSDCTDLAEKGLVALTIFTGGHHLNLPSEWIALPSMERTVDTLIELAQVWADASKK